MGESNLGEIVADIKNSIEKDIREKKACLEARKQRERDEETRNRRAQKEEDMRFIVDELVEAQGALEELITLREKRRNEAIIETLKYNSAHHVTNGIWSAVVSCESEQAQVSLERCEARMSTRIEKDGSGPHLVTPSLSPPPRFPERLANKAPSYKRQRLTSVSRSSSVQLPSNASEPEVDYEKEREASRARLLDSWSQLAERYSKRFDEDDIIDIRTAKILKDNGFLRRTRRIKFGEALESEGNGEDGEGDVSEDEEDVDELDAFSEGQALLEGIKSKIISVNQQPSNDVVSSEIAHDVHEFLEAEEKRHEQFGSDLEEELPLPDADFDSVGSSYPNTEAEFDEEEEEEEEDVEDVEEEESEEEQPRNHVNRHALEFSSDHRATQTDSDSADELDDWEPVEGSIVVMASSERDASVHISSDSEVEIVEPPVIPISISKKKTSTPQQLHTPPLSQASTNLSFADDNYPQTQLPASSSPLTFSSPESSPPGRLRRRRQQVSISRSTNTEPNLSTSAPKNVLVAEEDEIQPSSSLKPRSRARSMIPEVVIQVPSPHTTRRRETKHKRKRVSSEHEEGHVLDHQSPQLENKDRKGRYRRRKHDCEDTSIRHSKMPLHRFRSVSRNSSDDGDRVSSSDQRRSNANNNIARLNHGPRRFASTPASSLIQPQFSIPASSPAQSCPTSIYDDHATAPSAPAHPPPIADPRAQQIVTNAVQQLLALLLTPTHHTASSSVSSHTYTPSHHSFSSVGPNATYSTPTHPHPYPFTFDPSFSNATVPPDSPEISSSPIKPREKRKSLVSRSHSRGRRVSFHLNGDSRNDDLDSIASRSPSRDLDSPDGKRKERAQCSTIRSKNMPKWQTVQSSDDGICSDSDLGGYSSVDDEHELEEVERSSRRGRLKRVQRPGPEGQSLARNVPQPSSGSAKPRRDRPLSVKRPFAGI